MSLKQCLSALFLIFNILFFSAHALNSSAREFDRESMEAFKHDPEFNYAQDYAPSDSFITLMLAYLLSAFAGLFGALNAQWVFPLLFRILLIVGIIVAVWLIVRMKYGKVLSKDSRQFGNFPLTNFEQQDEDYQKLLKESLENEQYKLAVRYLFLSTLILLERQKYLKITKWKAPYDYLKELPEEKRSGFKMLTDLFENTWYGDYQPDNEAVDQGLQLYRQLQNA